MPCRTWSTIPTAAPSKRSTASCRRSSRRKMLLEMELDLKEIREKRTNLNAQEIGDDQRAGRAVEAVRPQPGLRRGRSPRMVKDGVQAAHRDAALRRRLGLVLRLGRAIAGRTPRPSSSTACKSPSRTTWPSCPACWSAASTGSSAIRTEQVAAAEERADQAEAEQPYKTAGRQSRRLRLHGAGRCRREERRDARLPLPRPRAAGRLRQGDVRPGPGKAGREGKAGDDPAEHRAVRRRRTTRTRRPISSCPRTTGGGTGTAARSRPMPITSSCSRGPIRKGELAPRLVKYLLNNRKHATYWNSTRDTALCDRGAGRLTSRPAARTSRT